MTTADLSIIDQHIAGALERLAENAQREVESELVTDAAERVFYRRHANAYRKALAYFLSGGRALQTPSGAWLVPSATRGGMVHSVSRDGHCTCEAGVSGHDAACWHSALITGYQVGYDDLSGYEAPQATIAIPQRATTIAAFNANNTLADLFT